MPRDVYSVTIDAPDHRAPKPKPKRSLLRTLAWLAVFGFGLFALAMGLLVVRLLRGPISLDFLTPRIVAALEPEDGSYDVGIGATELVWAGRARGIDLTVKEVAFTERGGAPIASLPEIAIHVSLPALLEGTFAAAGVDVISPEIRLVRETDGRVGLGLGRSTSATGGSSILDSFSGGEDANGSESPASAWLRRVVVRDGRLVLTDRESGFDTNAVDLQVDVDRDDGSLTVDLSGDLALGERRFPIRVHADRPEPSAAVQLAISAPALDPSTLVEATMPLVEEAGPRASSVADAVARLRMPLDVDVHLAAGGATPSTVRIRARGESGTLAMSPYLPQPVAMQELELEASLDLSVNSSGEASAERVAVDLTIDLGGPALKVDGSWKGDDGAVAVETSLTKLPASSIQGYWPASAAAEARAWVTSNITEGEVRAASASLTGTMTLGDEPGFALEKLDGRVDFVGLTVRYVDTMPPARGVSGDSSFSSETWKFAVRSGTVAGLDIPSATVAITGLSAPVTRIAIDAQARGPLRQALQLVDHEPLRYARRAGIDPSGATGSLTGRLQLAFPLDGAEIPPDLGAVVHADLRKIGLTKALGDHAVTDGNLRLDVRASTLTLSGNARIANAPCSVQWKEDLVATRGFTRNVDVQGVVDAQERTAFGFDLRPWLTGPVGVKARLEQTPNGFGSARVEVDLGPAAIAAPELRWTKARGAPGGASGTLALAHGSIVALDAFRLEAAGAHAHGRATLADGSLRAIDLTGELPAAKSGGERPDFTLKVTPAAEGRRLDFTSEDASALLKLILPDATLAGGALHFTGTTSDAKRGLDLDGSFTVEKFRLTESSVLARVMTLASLSGIVSALRSQGIEFDRLSSDLEYHGDAATFDQAVLTGPSLRLLFGGTVDGKNDRIDIDGTLVPPLYGLNALPGKIPVIGKLFRTGDGGFVGIDFTVRGEMKDPKVSVKPLSSLAPGVLKSLTAKPATKPAK